MTISKSNNADRVLIFSGSDYEKEYSYCRALKLGSHLYISGTTGYDYLSDTLADGAKAQSEQLINNAETALAKAGGTLKDIVRVRIYIANEDDYEPVMRTYAERFKGISPACTTVQAGLFDPDIKVEMDLDAVLA